MRLFISFLLAGLCLGFSAHATEPGMLTPETPTARLCVATPAVGAISYPGQGKIPTTNNLVQPTGKPDPAQGQIVYFMGKVLDEKCNPIPDALVELWQPDPFSKFIIPTESDMANPIAMFAGAGQTYTGEDGTFSFITLFPGTLWICLHRDKAGRCKESLERAPFLNVQVAGKPFKKTFSAGLFFENDRRNATDPVYKKLSPDQQRRITMRVLPSDAGNYVSGMRTYLELVIPTNEHYKGY